MKKVKIDLLFSFLKHGCVRIHKVFSINIINYKQYGINIFKKGKNHLYLFSGFLSKSIFLKIFFKKKAEVGPRIVHARSPDKNADYSTNVVVNTKYTVWNFIPMNLYEQFS